MFFTTKIKFGVPQKRVKNGIKMVDALLTFFDE